MYQSLREQQLDIDPTLVLPRPILSLTITLTVYKRFSSITYIIKTLSLSYLYKIFTGRGSTTARTSKIHDDTMSILSKVSPFTLSSKYPDIRYS
jgi:hypothetical protein